MKYMVISMLHCKSEKKMAEKCALDSPHCLIHHRSPVPDKSLLCVQSQP